MSLGEEFAFVAWMRYRGARPQRAGLYEYCTRGREICLICLSEWLALRRAQELYPE